MNNMINKNNDTVKVDTGHAIYVMLVLLFLSSFVISLFGWVLIFAIAYKRKQILLILNYYILINIILIIYPFIYIYINELLGSLLSIIGIAFLIIIFANNINTWQIKKLLTQGYTLQENTNISTKEIEDIQNMKYPFYIWVR